MPIARHLPILIFCAALIFVGQAHAISKIEPVGPPVPPVVAEPQTPDGTLVPDGGEVEREPLAPVETVPLPEPIPGSPSVLPTPEITGPTTAAPTDAAPALDDIEALPEPVKRMRALLLEAAKTGDIEKLRPLLGTGADATQLSVGEIEGDQIEYLKGQAGDPEGQEILAIMLDLLEAKFVHSDVGTAEELYVWPYFVERQLDKLTAPERVDLFRIVTAGDYEDMKTFGAYNFYRVGISPEGRFVFFVSGD